MACSRPGVPGVAARHRPHAGCNFDHKRFALVEPHLKKKGPEVCLRAVAGIAFDHFSTPRKNGSVRHFDEWERVFKDAGQVEERANSAPKDWRAREPFCVALVSLRAVAEGEGCRIRSIRLGSGRRSLAARFGCSGWRRRRGSRA